MALADYTKFANDNPVCYLATCDGDQPRVRGMALWYADDTGFYFHTGMPKHMTQQMQRNPKVEVCFLAPGPSQEAMKQMRISGEVEFVNDTEMKARLLEERPFLKAMVSGPDDPMLGIFRISHGEAHFWTLADNMREPEKGRF